MARIASSLDKLRSQVNATYPNRNKASDGWLGDAAHAASASDHNPNSQGVVCALDLTHDPGNGLDVHALADHIRTHRHPNLKYIISNSRICGAWTGWNWATYTGSNKHNKHAHFSVGVGTDGKSQQPYDNTQEWDLGGSSMTTPSTSTLRIAHSEIGGWDLYKTHNGDFDSIFQAAAGAKEVNQFIYEQWVAGGAYRARKIAAMAFYDKYNAVIGDLSSRPTKAELEDVVAKLAKANLQVEATTKKLAEVEAQRTSDTQLLDEAGSWFTKLVNRLFKKG